MTTTLADLNTVTSDDIAAALARDDARELELVSITIALLFPDPAAAEQAILRLARHTRQKVRANALISLGHLARRFRMLDESTVKPVMEDALRDPDPVIRENAHAAADEIHQFLHWNIKGHEYGRIASGPSTS